MEQWSFPPRFDARYVPPADSRYWFPVRETMPPGDRERAIVERLQRVTRHARDNLHAAVMTVEADFRDDHANRLR